MPGKTLYCLGEAWLELNSPAPLASAETFSPRMGGSAASLALAYVTLPFEIVIFLKKNLL